MSNNIVYLNDYRKCILKEPSPQATVITIYVNNFDIWDDLHLPDITVTYPNTHINTNVVITFPFEVSNT